MRKPAKRAEAKPIAKEGAAKPAAVASKIERTVHVRPYAVKITAADRGMDVIASARTGRTTRHYALHLTWNGWVPHLLTQMADAVAAKVDLTK